MTPYPQGAWKCSKWPFWGHFARWFWAVFKTWFSYRALSPDRGQLRIVTLSILEIRCATVEKTDKRCVTVKKTQKSFETAEKTDKSCVTLEKTHPWKRTWSPKAVSSQSLIFESNRKLREVESIFVFGFSCSPPCSVSHKKWDSTGSFRKKKKWFPHAILQNTYERHVTHKQCTCSGTTCPNSKSFWVGHGKGF